MKEVWKKIESSVRNQLVLAEVNCEEEADLCNEFRVGSYPTIYAFPPQSSTNTSIFHFNGDRTNEDSAKKSLLTMVKKITNGKPAPFIKQLLSDQQFKQSCITSVSRSHVNLVGCVIFNLPPVNDEQEEARHFQRLKILTTVM